MWVYAKVTLEVEVKVPDYTLEDGQGLSSSDLFDLSMKMITKLDKGEYKLEKLED